MLELLERDQQERILKYLDLVIEKNKELNLTRIDTKDKGILLHVEDSLSCLDEFNRKKGPFLDIGTGGGFPGVPLAIASGRSGTLIDSVRKKALAVRELADEVKLGDQLEVLGVRSEDLARTRPNEYETVVLRAVDSIPAALELAAPHLATQGEVILLKGKEDEKAVEEASAIAAKLGLELVSQRRFKLGDEFDRTILLFGKIQEPQMKLPRRNGMAHKKPLTA